MSSVREAEPVRAVGEAWADPSAIRGRPHSSEKAGRVATSSGDPFDDGGRELGHEGDEVHGDLLDDIRRRRADEAYLA